MKIVSINIEGHRHLDLILSFLKQEQADVINLQEVFGVDLPVLAAQLNMTAHFVPMSNVTFPNIHMREALGEWGIGQLYRAEERTVGHRYYVGDDKQPLPTFFQDEEPNSCKRAIAWVSLENQGKKHTIATTHFTWSPLGEATDLQRHNLRALYQALEPLPPFVITGDFNAPRGREIFADLASHYQDNIPPEYTTSIDGQFHKAGALELMVDGFFSCPEYNVSQVKLVAGVSDHQAIVGLVERR